MADLQLVKCLDSLAEIVHEIRNCQSY